MKNARIIGPVGFACLMLMVAGCTNTSNFALGPPAAEIPPWSGTWTTTWGSDDDADMISGDDLTFTQVGSSVIGTYAGTFADPIENYLGSVTGTVRGDALIGTWYESGAPETTGPLEFVMSADGNSFAGRWARAPDSSINTSNVTYRWNGARK